MLMVFMKVFLPYSEIVQMLEMDSNVKKEGFKNDGVNITCDINLTTGEIITLNENEVRNLFKQAI
jgi:hypothetical protein